MRRDFPLSFVRINVTMLQMIKLTTVERIDKWGTCLSFTCAIHCLAMPILLIALPLIGLEFMLDHTIETYFVIVTIMLATLTLWSGFKRHRQHVAFILFAVAVSFLLTGQFFDHDFHRPLVGFGAFGIASAHFLNRRLCAHARGCGCPEHR